MDDAISNSQVEHITSRNYSVETSWCFSFKFVYITSRVGNSGRRTGIKLDHADSVPKTAFYCEEISLARITNIAESSFGRVSVLTLAT